VSENPQLLLNRLTSATPPKKHSFPPILQVGFRPFFLMAGVSGSLFMILWLAILAGKMEAPYFGYSLWHGHEMVFGFASAMLAGFLLTAAPNWTGISPVHGLRLLALITVWIIARFLPFVVAPPSAIYMAIDLGFMPLTAYLMLPYLKLKQQKRNRIFFVCFLALFLGNAMIHGQILAPELFDGRQGLKLGLSGMVLALVVVGGRVIPFFTRNAVPEATVNIIPKIERLSLLTVLAWAIGKVVFEATWFAFLLSSVAVAVHAIRWWNWHSWQSRRNPILWVLHIGYFWLIVGFLFDALGIFGMPSSLATHAFTLGGIGTVGYGMMTRVALGHTGRPIRASALIVIGYVALNVATLIRVLMPLIDPLQFNLMIQLTGSLWVAAFLLFLWRYTMIFLKPRADGKQG
jgi:uncharacterized protein involved in response to NO